MILLKLTKNEVGLQWPKNLQNDMIFLQFCIWGSISTSFWIQCKQFKNAGIQQKMPYSLAVEKMKGRESHGFDLTSHKTYAATGAF
jgi:hypothetical protein